MMIIVMMVMMMIIVMMIFVMKMIGSNQPEPVTGETLPALRQEINPRLSLSPGFVLPPKIKYKF